MSSSCDAFRIAVVRMVEVLALEDCKRKLQNQSLSSPTLEDCVQILDAVTVYIQSSDADIVELAVIVDATKESIKCLFNTIDTLERDLEIQKKYEKLKELEFTALVGEIASTFEKKLVQCILKDTTVCLDYVTVAILEDALFTSSSGNESCRTAIYISDKDKSIALENWKRLDSDFELDNELYLAIGDLKHYRSFNSKINYHDAYNLLEKLEGDYKSKDQKMAKKMLNIILELDN